MRKMLWATATAAFFRPRRVVSRRNCAARYVFVRRAPAPPRPVRITVNSYSRNGGKRTGSSAQTVQEFRLMPSGVNVSDAV